MPRLPTLFISHGSPTFAIEPGIAGPALASLGKALPRPQTIHDFGGFPPALYQLQYPAPGAPGVAQRAIDQLRTAGWAAEADTQWGLDHGAWVPLRYLFPAADVPVFQVSLPARADAASVYAYGQALAPLSQEGVLIIGSGSLTHNLHDLRHGDEPTEAYAREFPDWIADTLQAGDHERLQQTMALAPHARRAHPTPEHLWPLMVAAGAAGTQRPVTRINGGVTHGVLSMDAFVFGDVSAQAAAT